MHLLPSFGCMSPMRDGHSTLWAPSRAFWPSACLVNNRLAWLTLSACRRWILNSIHPNLPSHPRARQRLQSCFHKSVRLTRCFWWADPRLGIGQFCCHNPLSPPILVQMTMSGQAKLTFYGLFLRDWHFSLAISSEYPQTLCHLYCWYRKWELGGIFWFHVSHEELWVVGADAIIRGGQNPNWMKLPGPWHCPESRGSHNLVNKGVKSRGGVLFALIILNIREYWALHILHLFMSWEIVYSQ